MQIEYDTDKNHRNITDRGLSFDRVVDFDFDTALIEEDTRKPYPEVRYVALGYLDDRLHVLCFTQIKGGIRVISFRKANKREIKNHEQTTTNH